MTDYVQPRAFKNHFPDGKLPFGIPSDPEYNDYQLAVWDEVEELGRLRMGLSTADPESMLHLFDSRCMSYFEWKQEKEKKQAAVLKK